ncbi:hypothetical protein [Hymenobacter koreensis]|uniref:Uncharacterized protein n=1 Tax=Hymenobacter koreensis TaxID=1084523 RepID=A0ABP8JEP3_9BACT
MPYTNQTGAERISFYLLDKYYELRKLNGRPPHLNMPTAADFALPAFRRVYAESLQDFVRFWRAQPINNPTYTAEPNGFGPVAIISLLRKLQTP